MKAAERAYRLLREEILLGRFGPGDRVTEKEITELAEVSRTPVREAMRRLEAEGLIHFVPNQGAFVRRLARDEARHIFELRARLESLAVRLAADNASDQQRKTLQQLAERQLSVSQTRRRGYLNRITELNTQFHETLIEAANSDLLRASLAPLGNLPIVLQTFRDYSSEDLERSARHHVEIASAISEGDPDWAAAVMRTHIYAAREVFRRRAGGTD